MYLVTKMFTDLQDNNYKYEVGSEYPREGLIPTKERIDELASDKNRQGVVLIKAVKGEAEPKKTTSAPKNTTKKSTTRRTTKAK